MVEMLAAAAIVGVLMAFVSQLLISTAAQQQSAEHRMLAAGELSNVAERLAMLTYEETTHERLGNIELSPSMLAVFPDASLSFEIQQQLDGIAIKRIDVVMTLEDGERDFNRPLQLSVWKFQKQEAAP